jgi:hypothetical protein
MRAQLFLAVPAHESDESPWRIQRLKGMNEYEYLHGPISGVQFPQSPRHPLTLKPPTQE